MFSILLVLLIIVAILMIGLILLQKSEGSGMSGSAAASMFGGALTGAAAGNFLTRYPLCMKKKKKIMKNIEKPIEKSQKMR